VSYREHLGMVIEKRGDGECVIALEADERHLNSSGIVHGGVLMSLADTAVGTAVQTLIDLETYRTVMAQLNTSFIKAAHPGRLVARGVVTSLGRRLAFGEAEVRQGDTLVAKASGVVYIQRRTPPAGEGSTQARP